MKMGNPFNNISPKSNQRRGGGGEKCLKTLIWGTSIGGSVRQPASTAFDLPSPKNSGKSAK